LKAFQYQKIYLDYVSDQTINKDAVQIAQLTESNLREERERLIEKQKESIDKERKEKEVLEIQRTKNLLITLVVAIVLVLGIIILFLRMKQIRSKQEQREAEMSQTLLRTQMNPHFVFNAMSVIQSYIFTHNPERSSKFLVNFSKLMRLILENSPKEFIPLELEAEILEKYLNTQKMRFEDRFEFEIQFEDDLLFKKALVPPMITQPFVENAIEHGQLHTIEGGKISISAVEENEMLKIIVQDNGIGRKNSRSTQKIKTHKSMAIDITRERIEIINRKYRSSGNLIIEDFDKKTGRGTIVTILLPLKFE
jgi:sensor histidine kinase YesM